LTNVLGFPLSDAAAVLAKEGFTIATAEVRSRKGVEGGRESRVIKQRLDGRNITLFYAVFKTQPGDVNA